MSNTVIVHRGIKITSCEGGWKINGYTTVFADIEAAKQHVQMLERPTTIKSCEVMSVSLLSNGTYGLSINNIRS